MSDAGYDPHALGSFFKELLSDQRLNPTGIPPYMLSHPLTEDRVANIETNITTEKLKTPPGRPAAGPKLLEVRALSLAIAEPADVVVADYKRAADAKPDDAQAQFLLGRVYQTIGQYEAARTALEKARALGIGDRVDRPLGSVYVALKSRPEAEAALGHWLAQHPDDGFAHLELGKAVAADDPSGAVKEFQRALTLDPDLEEAHRMIGLALGRQGKEGEGFYHLARSSELRGDLTGALSQFERAETLLDKSDPRRADVDQAIEDLRPIVSEMQRERAERRRQGSGHVGYGSPVTGRPGFPGGR
jgi:predicted Zn-dependent protease